jgi:hypothetical protein
VYSENRQQGTTNLRERLKTTAKKILYDY